MAEFTQRPLLSITAADLGHEPDELEPNLLRFFKNANYWDAIVLLDEADVYLERRSISDLKRNSIVSSKTSPRMRLLLRRSHANIPFPQYSYVLSTTSKASCSLPPIESAILTRPSCLAFTCQSVTNALMTMPENRSGKTCFGSSRKITRTASPRSATSMRPNSTSRSPTRSDG